MERMGFEPIIAVHGIILIYRFNFPLNQVIQINYRVDTILKPKEDLLTIWKMIYASVGKLIDDK